MDPIYNEDLRYPNKASSFIEDLIIAVKENDESTGVLFNIKKKERKNNHVL